MTKLGLFGIHQALYQNHLANAYLYYQENDNPCDNQGKELGRFYQDPFLFAEDLKKNVLPIVQKILERSPYQVVGVDFENQAPHPFFSICRKDHRSIQENDIAELKQIIDLKLKSMILMIIIRNL